MYIILLYLNVYPTVRKIRIWIMISDMEIQKIKNLPDRNTCASIEMQIINKFLRSSVNKCQ